MRPPAVLRVHHLIGKRAVTPAQAAFNRRNSHRGTYACWPRDREPGIAPFEDAASLHEAVERGKFPAPRAGPPGRTEWDRDEVLRWCAAQTKRKARTR
jgi:hypothetical protein